MPNYKYSAGYTELHNYLLGIGDENMKGTIELIGPKRVMVGVRTENDDYSVLELIGGYDPEIGDVLTGNLYSLGGETILNMTQDESWDVFIQDIYGSRNSAFKMLSKH